MDKELLETADGLAWACRFCTEFPSVSVDDALMWFSSAIETGRTAGKRELQERATELEGVNFQLVCDLLDHEELVDEVEALRDRMVVSGDFIRELRSYLVMATEFSVIENEDEICIARSVLPDFRWVVERVSSDDELEYLYPDGQWRTEYPDTAFQMPELAFAALARWRETQHV